MDYITLQTRESHLLNRYRQGDETAFRELVDRYKSSVCTFLRRFLLRPDQVDDVLQETLLQFYASRASYDVSRPLWPWLLTIAANKAKDALRRAKRLNTMPISGLLDYEGLSFEDILNNFASQDDDPSTRLDQIETAILIRRVVARLPNKQSEILTLAYFDQLTYKQIAETIRIPMGTVKSRLYTATRMFAREWSDCLAGKGVFCSTRDISLAQEFIHFPEGGCTQKRVTFRMR